MIWLVLALTSQAAEFALVPEGGIWSYLDNGVDPGPTWMDPAFDDSGWAQGPGVFGYGIGNLVTTIDYGLDPNNKPITTWFRRVFDVIDAQSMTGAVLRIRYDDAALVYLNGVELHRVNLPIGVVTPATVALAPSLQTYNFADYVVDATLLVDGDNTLAVEIHQDSIASWDMSFDLSLSAFDGPTSATRGPYLQRTTDTSAILRWRSLGPSDATVWYGTTQGVLDSQLADPTVALDHEIEISGLSADQRYYYAVGSAEGVLAGDDADHFFTTHPTIGTVKSTRIWALGDAGTGSVSQEAVRDAYGEYDGTAPDVLLFLGDNAYGSGRDEEYQAKFFDIYPQTLSQTAAWLTIGNHEGIDHINQTGPYYDMFSLPTQGEAGGLPSGTESYYSFDYANIHFVSLNSDDPLGRVVGGAMLTWLDLDLAATTQDWIIAIWHHPPYSHGSHNSDSELGMMEMRERANPILEAYGVDLVLTGHSHSYERSMLIDQHYGLSADLEQSMILDDSDGTRDDGFSYRKPTAGLAANEGAVYIVAGSAGQTSGGSLDHPAMHVSMSHLGSVVIDIDGDNLDAIFLQDDEQVTDTWAITKGVTSIVFLDGPRTALEGEVLNYEAYGQQPDGTEVASYAWDFGDNSPTEVTAQVTHTYPTEGVYPMKLSVFADDGEKVERDIDINILNGPPVIDPLVMPPLIVEGSPIQITATATDPSGDLFTFSWDMGDGTIIPGPTANHTYDDDGWYNATVTATDVRGGVSELDFVATVENADPIITSVIPNIVTESSPSYVIATATDPGIFDVLTFAWDLGDGSDPVVGAVLDHTFPDSGTWPVTLTVTDYDGGLAQQVVDVQVDNVNPTIDSVLGVLFAYEGDSVPFTAFGSDLGNDPITFTWDFGDGDIGIGGTVQHAYGNDGDRIVTVTADDGDGGIDIAEHPISIANLPPQIDALIISGGPVEGTPLSMAATASDPGYDDPIVISWDFGDGEEDEGPSVVHTWARDGVFIAAVTVTDDNGDGETMMLPLVVGNAPPVITSLPTALEGLPGSPWSYQAVATDPGDDALTWRISGPSGAAVDANGLVTWTPTKTHVGATFWFTLDVLDDAGDAAHQTWPVTVLGSGGGQSGLDHDDARDPRGCDQAGSGPSLFGLLTYVGRRR